MGPSKQPNQNLIQTRRWRESGLPVSAILSAPAKVAYDRAGAGTSPAKCTGVISLARAV